MTTAAISAKDAAIRIKPGNPLDLIFPDWNDEEGEFEMNSAVLHATDVRTEGNAIIFTGTNTDGMRTVQSINAHDTVFMIL